MPITIQNNKLQIRNAEGNYVSIDAVSDATVAERIAEINAAGATNVASVNEAGTTNVGNVNSAGATQVSAINTKATEVTAQLASSGEMEDMVAQTFNTSTAYSAGTYVIQTVNNINKLYRFNTDHAAGAWNASEVTEIKLGNEVTDLKSAKNALNSEVFPPMDFGWVFGTASTADGNVATSTTNIRTKLFLCKNGSKIYADDDYRVIVMKYNATTGAYIGSYGTWSTSYTVDGTYAVLVLGKYSNTATIANVSDVSSHIHLDLVADGKVSENATGIDYSPFIAQVPPLFVGGVSDETGQIYHDTNETWASSRVRTNIIQIHKGAKIIKKTNNYAMTICRYADFNIKNYIETVVSNVRTNLWTCPETGYYLLTFRLTTSSSLPISQVKAEWDFSQFYAVRDERIHINWIGTGNLDETTTATDSGDCAMVVFPDGDGVLIDSSNKRNYISLRKRILEAGFFHIPNIIISHFHSDHIGGILQLVASGYVDITGSTVYLPDYDETLWAYNNGIMDSSTKDLYDEAMTMFTNNSCVLVYPDTDFKPYEIGGAVLGFYNCDMSYYKDHSTNYNDWSLCNYIFYGNMNVNFTGDIGPIAQGHLGGTLFKTNVYKADHHGWLNQTTIPADYINNVSPDVVIAMDGEVHDQYIGTDTAPLIKWCEKYGVPYYRKYINDEIIMAVSKDSWAFETKVKRTVLPET